MEIVTFQKDFIREEPCEDGHFRRIIRAGRPYLVYHTEAVLAQMNLQDLGAEVEELAARRRGTKGRSCLLVWPGSLGDTAVLCDVLAQSPLCRPDVFLGIATDYQSKLLFQTVPGIKTFTGGIVLFAVIWFLVLFVVLPIRLVTQGDRGEIVLQVTSGGGFVPIEYNLTLVPQFSLYGDGTVIVTGPVIAIYPGPALPNLQTARVSEETVQAILSAAREAGLFANDVDYGRPQITDVPTTIIAISARMIAFSNSFRTLIISTSSCPAGNRLI